LRPEDYGPGVARGAHIPDVNNLDIAPTLLTILDLPIPREMHGRILEEAFSHRPAVFKLSAEPISV
jgi:arylsulfatase A-like enzyme